MEEIIEIKNLCLSIGNKEIFTNLSFKVNENSFLTIIGANNSGKSSLANILSLKKASDDVFIQKQRITKLKKQYFQSKILYLNDQPKNILGEQTTSQYLQSWFLNANISSTQAQKLQNKLFKLLKLKDVADKKFKQMSLGEKSRIQFLDYFLTQPLMVVLDNTFVNIADYYKEDILSFFKSECQKGNTTVINFTNDAEEVIYSTEVGFLLNNELKVMPLLSAYEEEQLFRLVSQKRPFMVELSSKLKYYSLIKDIYLDEEQLVDKLWK